MDDGPMTPETSLHAARFGGVSLRSVRDYSDTNPHAVYPGGGRHTAVIFEHHRKRT